MSDIEALDPEQTGCVIACALLREQLALRIQERDEARGEVARLGQELEQWTSAGVVVSGSTAGGGDRG